MNLDLSTLKLQDYETLAVPSGFARVVLNYDLYPWQQKTVDSLFPNYSKAALATCNDSGKTSLVIVTAILWHMVNFPWSMTVTTSASYRQILEQLYPTIKRILSSWQGWEVSTPVTGACSISAPNGSRCLSFSTDDARLAEGFHTPHIDNYMEGWTPPDNWRITDEDLKIMRSSESSLMMIMDESKGVKKEIFEAFIRCNANRYLYTSSPDPDDSSSEFYRFFHDLIDQFKNEKGTHNVFHADYKNCPHIMDNPQKLAGIVEIIRDRGEEDPFVLSWAFGRFSEMGAGSCFDLKKVYRALHGGILQRDFGDPEYYAGLDLSGGGDATVLCLYKGNTAWIEKRYYERDAIKLANYLLDDFRRYCIPGPHVNSDDGHQGNAIHDYWSTKNFHVNRINFQGKPGNTKQYANCRAEMYDLLNLRIQREELNILFDAKLAEQFKWIKRTSDETGAKMQIVPKKEMPKSPDELDSMVLALYNRPQRRAEAYMKEQQKRKLSIYPSDEEVYSTEIRYEGGLHY